MPKKANHHLLVARRNERRSDHGGVNIPLFFDGYAVTRLTITCESDHHASASWKTS
jgi:hypothetical protein